MASKILVDELAPYSHATDVTLATGKNITGANTQFKITGGSNLNHLSTDGSGNLSWVSPAEAGLTDINQWRLTTTFANTANPITGVNLVEVTNFSVGKLGSGMTYDSGTGMFTFPQTGIWVIDANFYFWQTTHSSGGFGTFYIDTTQDNGSGWDTTVEARTSDYYNEYGEVSLKWVFDVSDTTTHKCRFAVVQGLAAAQTIGSATVNKTYFTFSRVGATP